MTKPGQNPFQRLNKGLKPEDVRAEQALSFEHSRVKFTLQKLQLDRQRKVMQRQADQQGSGRFSFRMFNEFFPRFPLYMAADKLADSKEPLHRDIKAIHPEWFKGFLRLPFMRKYRMLFDSLGPEETQLRPIGLVFPRRGFAQGLVVHNGDLDTFVPLNSSCHVHLGGGKEPMTLIVQPYTELLEQIRTELHWRPDDRD